MSVEKLQYQSFRDVDFLNRTGGGVMNVWSAMDYFSTSQFYDKQCNNEVLKMQQRFSTLNQPLQLSHQDPVFQEELSKMVGIEYQLVHCQEPVLFVIRKQKRLSQQSVMPIESFYIIEGTIYQAPSLMAVLQSRLSSISFQLDQFLSKCQSSLHFSQSAVSLETETTSIQASKDDDDKMDMEQEPSNSSKQERQYQLGVSANPNSTYFWVDRVETLERSSEKLTNFSPTDQQIFGLLDRSLAANLSN